MYPDMIASEYEAEYSPNWILDSDLGSGKVRYLGTEEARFWREVVARYLHPLPDDPVKKKKMEQDLKELRNKMSLLFFLLNALFIVVISALQYTNAANDGNGLAIPLPCKNDEGQSLTLEPISLLFMATFGIALVIQFLAMFFHRMGTFLHIISSTEVRLELLPSLFYRDSHTPTRNKETLFERRKIGPKPVETLIKISVHNVSVR